MRLSAASPPIRIAATVAAAPLMALLLACGGNPVSSTNPRPPVDVPTRITVSPDPAGPAEVYLPGTLQLKARGEYANGEARDVTSAAVWRSSDPTLAVVSASGLVRPGKIGGVDVSASVGSVVGSVHVNVLTGNGSCREAALSQSDSTVDATINYVGASVSTPFSDCRWTARSEASWITLGPSGETFYDPGRSGDGSIQYQVAANFSLSPRSSRILVSFTDGTVLTYAVNQDAARCVYLVDPKSRAFGLTGGSGTISVTTTPANCAWVATGFEHYDPAWGFSASGSGIGAGTVRYAVTPTIPHYQISFRIWITGPDPRDPPAIFTVMLAASQE